MPVRFDYAEAAAGRTDGSRLAYLPITLRHAPHELAVVGLLDKGDWGQRTFFCASNHQPPHSARRSADQQRLAGLT